MSIFLDPREPVDYELEGILFKLRVFNSTEMARFTGHFIPLQKAFSKANEGESVELDDDLVEHLEAILRLGIVGWKAEDAPKVTKDRKGYLTPEAIGAISFSVWMDLLGEIVKVNTLTEEDAKN